MPASGQVGQSKPGFFIAEIRRFIGGWQADTPRQDGLEDEAHSRTSQPHSLAAAEAGGTAAVRNSPRTTWCGMALAIIGTLLIKHTNE
jgi:hypothetical protein